MSALQSLLAQVPRPASKGHRSRGRAWASTLFSALCLLVCLSAWAPGLLGSDGSPVWRALHARWAQGLVLSVLGGFYLALARRRRGARARARDNLTGVLLLAAGRADEAAAHYDRLAREETASPLHRAVYLGNRGVVALVQGEVALGRQLLAEALRSGQFRADSSPFPGGYYAAWMARSHALQGDLPTAHVYREEAAALLPPNRRATLLIADAVMLLRSGTVTATVEAIEASWMGAEGELAGHERRALRALHAFALAQLGREPEAEAVLAGLWPHVPNQLEYLGRDWPELGRFLRARTPSPA